MKEVTYVNNGQPRCPDCEKEDLEINMIDNNNRLRMNCIWCSNGALYANLNKCNPRTINKVIQRLKRKKYQSSTENERKKIDQWLETVNSLSV